MTSVSFTSLMTARVTIVVSTRRNPKANVIGGDPGVEPESFKKIDALWYALTRLANTSTNMMSMKASIPPRRIKSELDHSSTWKISRERQ